LEKPTLWAEGEISYHSGRQHHAILSVAKGLGRIFTNVAAAPGFCSILAILITGRENFFTVIFLIGELLWNKIVFLEIWLGMK
jgi:hypothetical protein